MHVIEVDNVNQALPLGLEYLEYSGHSAMSRNGPVVVAPGPVATVYKRPWERVLFCPVRDANPVFHLMEALWMFAGRNDVASLLPFNANYQNYAEEDGRVHGAYGHRWRQHFDRDQLMAIIYELKTDPQSRRAVLTMWDAREDLSPGVVYKDVPCNTHVYFGIDDGYLNMTVCCRSNDVVWGAYGANVVHFSMTQELVASACGVKIGKYTQFSNNYHIYPENPVAKRVWDIKGVAENPYADGMPTKPMITGSEDVSMFLRDCEAMFSDSAPLVYETAFFEEVAGPLRLAYLRRRGKSSIPYDPVMATCDWTVAYQQWVARRDGK